MHPFRFKLEVLLKYRRMQEEQAQIELSQATAAYLQEKETLGRLRDKLASQQELIREHHHKTVTVATLKMLQNYYDKVIEEARNQQKAVEFADSRRLECIALLEKAMKERKSVEKLKEKRMLQYQLEVLQEEQKHLDELGLSIFSRRN